MTTRRTKNQVETLEIGDIFLLDWPEKVAENLSGNGRQNGIQQALVNEAEPVETGEKFYMLMHPSGWCHHRLIHIVKKSEARNAAGHRNYSGCVDEIVCGNRQLTDYVEAGAKGIKTYYHPPLATMRLVAMGEYQLVHLGNHTQLRYQVEPPQNCHAIEHDFHIGSATTYIIGVKHQFSASLQEAPISHDHQSAPDATHGYYNRQGFPKADPPELLNEEGAEIWLIAMSDAE